MKKISIVIFILLSMAAQSLMAQSTHDFLISGGLDLIKTDNTKIFDKAQFGVDVNYFIERRFSVGAGAELWTKGANSFVMGVRWYPVDKFFVRFRGLIGSNNVSMGAGWSQPLNRNFRLEAIGDIYFAKPDFALRGGVSYVINYVTGK